MLSIVEKKVRFLCVGAQKCGTTTLRAYLNEHAQLDVPVQEVHFFDNESMDWGKPDYVRNYHGRFSSLRADVESSNETQNLKFHRVPGEVTPIYMYWNPCLGRIRDYNPEVKLIFLLRNPIARAYSHWAMEFSRGYESLSFSEAIRLEKPRCEQAWPLQHRIYSYLDRGCYHRQITAFADVFPPRNLLVLSAEILYKSPRLVLDKVSAFLEVSPFGIRDFYHMRKGAYGAPMLLSDWNYIYERLCFDMCKLAALVDWDSSDWHQPWQGVE